MTSGKPGGMRKPGMGNRKKKIILEYKEQCYSLKKQNLEKRRREETEVWLREGLQLHLDLSL
jgi:hypothetical protein